MESLSDKVHLKCNYQSHADFQYIKFSNKIWHCYKFNKDFFQLTKTNNVKLYSLVTGSIVIVIQINHASDCK